jgi:hypothetical protein
MKKNYNRQISLRYITCGDTDFETNDDKTWVKCVRCEKEYHGGYDELVQLNQATIDSEINKMKDDVAGDFKKDITDMLKKLLKEIRTLN